MDFIYDLIQIIKSGLGQLTVKNYYITIGVAILLSVLCAVICSYYSRLWNKTYRITITHKILSVIASLLTFFFILTFVGLSYLKEIAQYNITSWANDLVTNQNWIHETTKKAYYKVKDSGLEDFTNYPEPNETSVNIPVSKSQTIKLCANHFAKEACTNFDDKHPFLSKIVGAKSGIPSELVQNDVKNYFGNIAVQATEPTQNAITTDDEFTKRLNREKGKSGEIQLTLLWNNYNDLDLHCIDPSGEEIYFANKTSSQGGLLDVDMNAGRNSSDKPIENIYWANGNTPEGHYKVMVNHYALHEAPDPTYFKVRVIIDNQIKEFEGSLTKGDDKKVVYEFDYTAKAIKKSKSYQVKDAVRLVAKTIREDLEKQAPRVVKLSRIILVILFLLVQLIPFGLIGYAAYKNLKIKT